MSQIQAKPSQLGWAHTQDTNSQFDSAEQSGRGAGADSRKCQETTRARGKERKALNALAREKTQGSRQKAEA